MNGLDFIADTNAVIYLLAGNSCMEPFLDKRLGISVISKMELLSYPNITSNEEERIRTLLNTCNVVPIGEEVVAQTVAYRRKHKIKLPDAIIAATATVCGVPLITADAEIAKVDGLLLENIVPA